MSETTYSDRGFAQELRDMPTECGHTVSVYESSSASGPHLWLDVIGSTHMASEARPRAGIPFGVAEGSTAAHMSVEQAREVHAAIGRWLAREATR